MLLRAHVMFASRTKLVAGRTRLVVATTKPVATRTLSSFDGISMELGVLSLGPSATLTRASRVFETGLTEAN